MQQGPTTRFREDVDSVYASDDERTGQGPIAWLAHAYNTATSYEAKFVMWLVYVRAAEFDIFPQNTM